MQESGREVVPPDRRGDDVVVVVVVKETRGEAEAR